MTTSIPLTKALNAWRKLLGSNHVLTDTSTLSTYETATFKTTQRIPGILQPADRSEVQECVRIANRYRVPLYPVSRGRNWGLGSRVPVQNSNVILDLHRLNRIIDYNEKLAYIVVEPGVTFLQAYDYLTKKQSKLLLSVIGGPADASMIGNAVERGDGGGPYGTRMAYICAFEVVSPTGECIHTGFSRFADAQCAHTHLWGTGPYIDGLFTQSNLGVVTQMTFWLAPMPKYPQLFECMLKKASGLPKFIDQLQTLFLHGVLKDCCFTIWNSYKMLAGMRRYPWDEVDGRTPLFLKKLKGVEPWFGAGTLHSASRKHGRSERKIVRKALRDHLDSLNFFDLDEGSDFLNALNWGVPCNSNIKSTYWRKQTEVPETMDPDRDGCGVIWLCLALPFDGKSISEFIPRLEVALKQYKFEPNLGLHCISARSVYLYVAVMYDREIEGEDERAMRCYDQLMQMAIKAGYYPYRLGIQSMDALPRPRDDYGKVMFALKSALDPNTILAPGRYEFQQDE